MIEELPPTVAPGVTGIIDASDLRNTVVFAALALPAWVLPERSWSPLARLCATVHLALRGSQAADLGGHPSLAATNHSLKALERAVLAGNYEEILQTLREHRPGGWRASIRLEGLAHLENALAAGRGAVLWAARGNFSDLNVKKALHSAGHPIINLRSDVHPYSGTRFGCAVLNRVRTSVEDRYLAGTVTLHADSAPAALLGLQARLRDNAIVTVAASHAGTRPCRLPFLGGTLYLAMGGATLARIAKAPLLPVFASPARHGSYVVEIQPPLEVPEGIATRKRDELAASAFAVRLEKFVQRNPSVWRGWFNRIQWEPLPAADSAT